MIREKRILITGATGYIGSQLVQSLEADNQLYCTYRAHEKKVLGEGIEWISWDMVDEINPNKLPKELDVIIDLAMNPARDPEKRNESFKVNTMRTLDLLEYGKKARIETFLFTSSGSVYGFGDKPFKEDNPVNIQDLYSFTKYSSELLVGLYRDDFNTSILRYFVPYGPGQTGKLVPNLVNRTRNDETITITNEGNPVMNPIYITDLMEATLKSLELKDSHIINVGGTEPLSILDMANIIGEVLGKKPVLKFIEDPEKVGKDLVGDITRMKELLSFTPKVSFKHGIKNLV
jgi:nucleoside-diphosphate-sugar epimerase